MRRRALTLSLLTVLVAVFVLEQGAQIFTPVAEIAGLSSQYAKEYPIVPATLYSVPAANYTFASESLPSGQYVGSLVVADARQVGFYVMNEGNFSLWRVGRPASLILANPSAISYNFSLSPTSSGTYYFVFDNPDNSPVAVVFALNSVQNIMVLNPFVEYAGYELLLVGVVLSIFGLRGGGSRAKTKRSVQAVESGWKCKFCGAKNPGEQPTFCYKCGRAQG